MLICFGTKVDGMLANKNDVAISEADLGNSFIVYVCPIEAFHVLNHITVRFPINLGVMSRDGRIVDAEDIIRLTADSDYAASWNYFAQNALLKRKR